MKLFHLRNISLIIFVIFVVLGLFALAKTYFGIGVKNAFQEHGTVIVDSTATTQPTSVSYTVEAVTGNLNVPWSMVWTNTSRMLVAERPGRIRAVVSGALQDQPLLTLDDVSTSDEEGLMGLAVDPAYKVNRYLYACVAYKTGKGLSVRIDRLLDDGNSIHKDKVILDGILAAQFHAGCRLRFGPDGKLYVTTGDATNKDLAQDLSSLNGKILRLNTDGSIPSDNPIPQSYVYSYGHRNPQGIDWHPVTHVLFETEHGPTLFDGPAGGDEVNSIEAGKNYGWPVVSHEKHKDGMVDPLLVFTPAVAPASGIFYTSKNIPQFKNNFFFGGLIGETIIRVILSETAPHRVLSYEKLPNIFYGRIRDIEMGPDGNLYFSTSNRDGRGKTHEGDDHIYRIVPTAK